VSDAEATPDSLYAKKKAAELDCQAAQSDTMECDCREARHQPDLYDRNSIRQVLAN
jgi:hypothetical protein